jgi:hypothetical protein
VDFVRQPETSERITAARLSTSNHCCLARLPPAWSVGSAFYVVQLKASDSLHASGRSFDLTQQPQQQLLTSTTATTGILWQYPQMQDADVFEIWASVDRDADRPATECFDREQGLNILQISDT